MELANHPHPLTHQHLHITQNKYNLGVHRPYSLQLEHRLKTQTPTELQRMYLNVTLTTLGIIAKLSLRLLSLDTLTPFDDIINRKLKPISLFFTLLQKKEIHSTKQHENKMLMFKHQLNRDLIVLQA